MNVQTILPLKGPGQGGMGWIVELSLICYSQNLEMAKFFVGINFSSVKSDEFFLR